MPLLWSSENLCRILQRGSSGLMHVWWMSYMCLWVDYKVWGILKICWYAATYPNPDMHLFFQECVFIVCFWHPCQIYWAAWWMGHYGSLTMKRHIAWSSCPAVNCLDQGVMAKEYQERHFRHGVKSARSYLNKKGKKAYHGTKHLKGTGTLSYIPPVIFFVHCLIQLLLG